MYKQNEKKNGGSKTVADNVLKRRYVTPAVEAEEKLVTYSLICNPPGPCAPNSVAAS